MALNRVLQALDPITYGMPRTLFLLSPSKVKGGNYCTIARIRSHLVKHGHTCMLWDLQQLEQAGEDVNQVLGDLGVDLVIGIHAYRTGKVMKDFKVPYILILGGTDVNEFYKDDQKLAVMTLAVSRASFVISFCESLQKKALCLWPELPSPKLTVITQAVTTNPCQFNLHTYLQAHHDVWDTEDKKIFLLVGAVRPVKNPLYLIETFTEWHRENSNVLFVIIGPVADTEYYDSEFQPALKSSSGVIHIPGLTSEETHAAVQQSFALVNTSESEGMSLAVLEAMQLKTPVLARNIPGNCAIVNHGETGLLFSSPEEFLEKAERMVRDSAFRDRLIKNAEDYTSQRHSMKQEEAAYLDLIKRCLADTNQSSNATTHITNGVS